MRSACSRTSRTGVGSAASSARRARPRPRRAGPARRGERTRAQDPSQLASRSVHVTRSSRSRLARRGAVHRSRSARLAASAAWPSGSAASSASTACRTAGAEARSRSAPRALRGESFASRVPTIAGTRVDGSHAETSVSQRSPGSSSSHASNAGVGSQRGSTSRSSATSPATHAVSTTSAAVGSSTSSAVAVRRRSRTPRPPARSTGGPAVPHQRPSSATRRHARWRPRPRPRAPAAQGVPSSSAPVPSAPGSGARVRRAAPDPPRAAGRRCPDRTRPAAVREEPLDRSARRGRPHLPVGALHGSRRGPPGELVEDGAHAVGASCSSVSTVPVAARCSASRASATSGSWLTSRPRSSSSSASRCGERRPSASARDGPSPAGCGPRSSRTAETRCSRRSVPHTRARRRSSATTSPALAPHAFETAVTLVGSGSTDSTSATCSSGVSRRSSARWVLARVVARVASAEDDVGRGAARSGRAANRARRSSSARARRSSARVRGVDFGARAGAVGIGRSLGLCSDTGRS